jgi:prolyl oligopeptidase
MLIHQLVSRLFAETKYNHDGIFRRLVAILFLTIGTMSSTTLWAQSPPIAPLKPVTDTYHGVKIEDPYRYLEEFQNPEVQTWVKAQAEHAANTLRALPGREQLLARVVELDAGKPFTISEVSLQPNGDLFYFKRLAAEKVAKLYFKGQTTGQEQLLIDPETFPKTNPAEHFSLVFYRVSPDSTKVLYGFAASGSEQTTLRVYDRLAGKDLPEAIDRLETEYAQPEWLPDGKAFVYSRRRKLAADAPAAEGYKFTQAWLHRLGTEIAEDKLIFAQGSQGSPKLHEMDFPAVILPQDSAWAIGQVKHGDETDLSLYVAKRDLLGTAEIKWTKICDQQNLVTSFAVHGDDIFLLTAVDAPRFKVVRTSLAQPDFDTATTVVPPSKNVAYSLDTARDALYVGLREGVRTTIQRVPYRSPEQSIQIKLPEAEPSASVAAARPDLEGVLVGTSSWTKAGRLYLYANQQNQLIDTKLLPQGKFDSPEWLTSTEVLVPSHDGIAVPLSIVHRRDIKLDGQNPTFLTGYGAYGHFDPMHFQPTQLAWLERGGVLAVAHVRGGGAFGKEWHHAGRKQTKPNTWKDFIASAEYLIREGYTTSAKLAGGGGSAGGILIGCAVTERPDLFAAAWISVGCTDMLRFETTMNGPPNVPEFGSTANEAEFRALLAMSTLHQIKDGTKYPAILLTHGANDPRVEPWISAKTTARFQAATGSGKPVLFRVDFQAGHGIGSTRQQRLAEMADVWSFLLWQFGDQAFQPLAK